MRKNLLAIASLLISGSVMSQINVTHEWIAQLGDTVILSEDTLRGDSIDVGTPGGNKVWDFTSLEEHKPDGAILEDPSTAPLSSLYPSADFVINDIYEDSVHIFFKQTNDYLDIVGIVEYDSVGNPTPPEFDLQWRFMEFPASMDSAYQTELMAGAQTEFLGIDPDSAGPHPMIDSFRNKFYWEIFSEIDAWGELQLPNGTFLSIRQNTWNRVKIVSDWYGNGQWQPFSNSYILMNLDSISYDTGSTTLRWWGNNPAATFFLAQIELDELGEPDSNIEFFNGEPVSPVGINQFESVGVDVFPNPVTDILHVEVGYEGNWSMNLFDAQARLVKQANSVQSAQDTDVSQLPAGAYLLQINDESGRLIALKKIQIVH